MKMIMKQKLSIIFLIIFILLFFSTLILSKNNHNNNNNNNNKNKKNKNEQNSIFIIPTFPQNQNLKRKKSSSSGSGSSIGLIFQLIWYVFVYIFYLIISLIPSSIFSYYSTYTLTGTGFQGYQDGTLKDSTFYDIKGINYGPSHFDIYVTDGHAIRKIHRKNNLVETLSGKVIESGFKDGDLKDARFNNPNGIAIDPFYNVYVCDTGNKAIRKIDQHTKKVTTLFKNLTNPHSIMIDGANLVFTDQNDVKYGNYYYENTPRSIAGSNLLPPGEQDGFHSKFSNLTGIRKIGNTIHVIDNGSHKVKGLFTLFLFGSYVLPYSYTYVGTGKIGDKDGITDISFGENMYDFGYDGKINFISDTFNNKIRVMELWIFKILRISFNMLGNGESKSVNGKKFGISGQPTTSFNKPKGICIDNFASFFIYSSMYVVESGAYKIRVVDHFNIFTMICSIILITVFCCLMCCMLCASFLFPFCCAYLKNN